MFTEYTTLEQMQATIWDFYKDVHGFRPRHFTQQEWDSMEFLQREYDNLCKIVDNMSPEQKRDEGWGYDDSMDGDHASALASAGWGTDEDYGYSGEPEYDW
jgi:hypothetical protein